MHFSKRSWSRVLMVVLAAGGPLACESERPVPAVPEAAASAAGPAWFEEVSEARGLRFRHLSGHRERYLMPEIMVGGAALLDMDGDGDLDAYLVQSGGLDVPPADRPPNQLFRNLDDGTFEDVTLDSGADDRGYGMGVSAADYDSDGDVDLYVTNVGPNVLLRNDGTGRFADVTTMAGVGDPSWSASAAFVDYDSDGDLDLYVANYLDWSASRELSCYSFAGAPDYCSPKNYNAPTPDTLYRNDGDGTFTDVSASAGIRVAFGTGLGVTTGDFDGDGRQDIFVANDGMMNQLWLNQGDGTFDDGALVRGAAIDQDGKAKAGMGVFATDVDDDGDLDVLVVNLDGESDSFYRNEGEFFVDHTAMVGLRAVSRPFTRFGMALLDFDNDGRLDLYQANGRVGQQSELYSSDPFAEPNLLFRGVGTGAFEELRPQGGTSTALVATSRAAAFGDLDGDGGIDVLVVNKDEDAYLLHNVAPDRGHWIAVRAVNEHGRDAIGATVILSVGTRRVTRDVRTAYSYLASNDPRVHVGLGEATEVDDVQVRWIDGSVESFGAVEVDRVITLRKGAGTPPG